MRPQGILLHFMNSLFEDPEIYSCAIDCFLEVSRYIFQPALLNLSVKTQFIDLLHNALSECLNLSKKTQHLCATDTAFGRVLAVFLNEDVYEYRNDVDKLIEKPLMLESTDFYLSQNERLVTKYSLTSGPSNYSPSTRNNTMHTVHKLYLLCYCYYFVCKYSIHRYSLYCVFFSSFANYHQYLLVLLH